MRARSALASGRSTGWFARGELVRVRRGVYRGRGVRWDLRAQLRAALSEQGDGARLVLVSSLHWQGLLLRPAGLPQVGVPGDDGARYLPHRTVHRTSYARPAPVTWDGLPCAGPFDALRHLAGWCETITQPAGSSGERFARQCAAMLRWSAVWRTRSARRHFAALANSGGARAAARASIIRSDLEEDFVAFCEIWGLPWFEMNRKVGGSSVTPSGQTRR